MNNLDLLEQQAIDATISLKWHEAIEFNKQILEIDKKNLSAYLRLGFIYLQLNKLKEAKKMYQKALKIQSSNQLARENLERIKILEMKGVKKTDIRKINLDPNLFLEIPGKTKSVNLINLGQKNILAQLMIGQEIFLKPKRRKIEIRTKNGDYIGSLADDLSKRLILFIKAGSQYSAFIKETSLNKVVVFIREEKKGKRVLQFSSFPKNTTVNLSKLAASEEASEGEEENLLENDLEKLAEALASEDKDYIPLQSGDEVTEENEE